MRYKLESLGYPYPVPQPNEPIMLRQNVPIEIRKGKDIATGRAHILFRFLPFPKLIVVARFFPPHDSFNRDSVHITVTDENITFKAFLVSLKITGNFQTNIFSCKAIFWPFGRIRYSKSIATTHFKQVECYVVNMLNFYCSIVDTDHDIYVDESTGTTHRMRRLGCSILTNDNWIIAIRSFNNTHLQVSTVRDDGGYAITHRIIIRRKHNQLISEKHIANILEALKYLLSFARGMWITPIIPVAFNRNKILHWEEWGTVVQDQWISTNTWYDEKHGEMLGDMFPGFMKLWNNMKWRKALKTSLYWYVNGNDSSKGIDIGVILGQAALEYLSWHYLVIIKRIISKSKYNNRRTCDNLIMLIDQCEIPTYIPSSLNQLKQFANNNSIKTGPEVITAVRNEIVHPKTRKHGMNTRTLYQAWLLCYWYLDLIYLYLFEHKGFYSNRITKKWIGDICKVPWSK